MGDVVVVMCVCKEGFCVIGCLFYCVVHFACCLDVDCFYFGVDCWDVVLV